MRIAFALLVAVLSGGWARAETPDGLVVIFLVDTLRPDRMSTYGAPHATTPAADRLARDGVIFEHAYARSSWTRASVGTLFTSRLPAEAGTLDQYGSLDKAVATLPQLLHDRGWKTAAFVGNVSVSPLRGFGRGFDSFDLMDAAEPGFGGHPRAQAVVDPAVRFVEHQGSPRFFLYVHVLDPHLPFNLEPGNRELLADEPKGRQPNQREALFEDYDRAIRQADDQFARLAAALRAKGFWVRATVVYTADHGEEFFEHGNRGHGQSVYEEQVRVPLVVKFPGTRTGDARRPELVSLADLLPTLAGLHGLARDSLWIGSDLREKLPERPLYLTEDFGDWRVYAVRSGAQKLVVQLYPEFQQRVFDLGTDPGEQHGRSLACGASLDPSTQALVRLFENWRERELQFFPGVHFEKRANEAIRVVLLANLADQPQPFLTADDFCTGGANLREFALRVNRAVAPSEPFHLSLPANDKGELPPYRLYVFDAKGVPVDTSLTASVFRVNRVVPLNRGDAPDDEVKKLRSLGYLGGGGQAQQRP